MLTEADSSASCFRSERFVICVEANGVRYKVIQTMFQRRDGSLFVAYPYYEHTTGLVNVARLMPGASELSLIEPGAAVTSHLVKYSHHGDGRVHFSQDGKVFTGVRKQSVPLDLVDGHIFTAQIQGLRSFAPLDRQQYDAPPSTNRTILNFQFQSDQPEAVKIVGRMHTQSQLLGMLASGTIGSTMTTVEPDGSTRPAFVLSAPTGRPGEDRYLLLSCWGIPALTTEETTLTFIGGFDPPSIVNDHSRPTELLTLAYPAENPDQLREQIGTIDLPN